MNIIKFNGTIVTSIRFSGFPHKGNHRINRYVWCFKKKYKINYSVYAVSRKFILTHKLASCDKLGWWKKTQFLVIQLDAKKCSAMSIALTSDKQMLQNCDHLIIMHWLLASKWQNKLPLIKLKRRCSTGDNIEVRNLVS